MHKTKSLSKMNKKLRITITVILVLFLAGMILYPKFKPFLLAKFGPKNINTPLLRQSQQKLNATGYLIAPLTSE